MSDTVMERPKPTTVGDPKPRTRTKKSPPRDYIELVNRYGDFHFVTHNHVKDIETDGSSLVGHLEDISFYRLIETFGRPSDNFDDYKSDAEWDIEFDDGLVATIYNWKNGLNYTGKIDKDGNHGLQLTDMNKWNVGGKDPKVLDRLLTMLKLD